MNNENGNIWFIWYTYGMEMTYIFSGNYSILNSYTGIFENQWCFYAILFCYILKVLAISSLKSVTEHSLLFDRMNSLITSKGSGGISFENLVSDDQVQENPPLLLALVSHLAERTMARSIDAENDFVKKIEKIQYHIQEKVSKAVRSDFRCSRKS